MIHHNDKPKNRDDMIISTDAEKLVTKFNIYNKKTLNKVGIKGTYANIRKTMSKSIANIISKGEKLKAFPPISRSKQGCPLSLFLFNMVLEVPAIAMREEKESKLERKN